MTTEPNLVWFGCHVILLLVFAHCAHSGECPTSHTLFCQLRGPFAAVIDASEVKIHEPTKPLFDGQLLFYLLYSFLFSSSSSRKISSHHSSRAKKKKNLEFCLQLSRYRFILNKKYKINVRIFRIYRTDYNNNPPSSVACMPTIVSTSGRLHSEFVRLLFLQDHWETDHFFETSEIQLPSSTSGQFHYKRVVFSSHLRSKVRNILFLERMLPTITLTN